MYMYKERWPQNNKNGKNAFFIKTIHTLKQLIKNVVNKYKKLCKPNEKNVSQITVLVCMITIES